jgi:hypothetical protein
MMLNCRYTMDVVDVLILYQVSTRLECVSLWFSGISSRHILTQKPMIINVNKSTIYNFEYTHLFQGNQIDTVSQTF